MSSNDVTTVVTSGGIVFMLGNDAAIEQYMDLALVKKQMYQSR